MSHNRSKQEKLIEKNFSPKETRKLKQENKKCEGGGFKMTPQRLLPSPHASGGVEETEEMQEI